ncbi:lipid particle protein [Moelleriella libera RCEF 2490]|uniref:Lipid particle protein n=1 Tax=Moelleriella libera RCEF 2490 TaxID=1081109 RepID=A0A166V9Y2_9HYPO|nr:lipid particle protein [Moelleriella libera RCEF 2490]
MVFWTSLRAPLQSALRAWPPAHSSSIAAYIRHRIASPPILQAFPPLNMAPPTYPKYEGGTPSADHLCVLVHGLWGNPDHMRNVAKSLRDLYPPSELRLLFAKRNSGSFTYDGIERGGERICSEIEEELRAVQESGGRITKISIVGYSLGGLVCRYAVGLLYAKGILDKLECMNFTTFASPHLGVRTPLKGWHNHVWNVMGARTLSMSGRQLFTIDSFRDTGRPLLSVLAEPSSIFMLGLRKFKRHTLYTNIINDRSAVFYTTGIQKTDPFRALENIKVNTLAGYGGVILDPKNPVQPSPKLAAPPTFFSVTGSVVGWVKRIPFMVTVAVFVPVGVLAYLCNSVIQNFRSSQRIKLYERGEAGVSLDGYRVPVLIKELREEVENAYEALNSSQNQEFLATEDEDDVDIMSAEDRTLIQRERRQSMPTQPTLALTPHQFEMIRSLDTLRWRKYPVWIHNHRHSHAAIIVRMDKKSFDEGWVVLKHFAADEFLI